METSTCLASPPLPTPSSSPHPPPRLIITKMTLENFKSYAGIREIGPFHKRFSSIVGPNGSGKSNVIDAMLFVFGKRAKKLRLNKVSELIHSSDAYKKHPLSHARVSVHFVEIVDTGDGDEDYEIIDGSEVVVSRIARRDNSSAYKLNGKNCMFRDVATFLSAKGIDLDNNRFLILQGEVEMISMMPPKGRNENDEGLLEYLEDIIGSNKFLEETNEAAKKVESLTEMRQEKLNRVKAVEAEKESLAGAKAEVEALLSKEREIRRKKNILFQLNAMDVKNDYEKIKMQKEEASKKLDDETKNLKEVEEKITEIEKSIGDESEEYNALHNEMKETKKKFSSYQRKEIKMEEDMKHLKDKVKKLTAKVKSESTKEKESTEKSTAASESIPDLEERIVQLKETKNTEDANLEALYEGTKEKTQTLRVKLEEKTKELGPVEEERSGYQSTLDTAKREVELLNDATVRAKEQLDNAEKELASLDERQEKKRGDLGRCEDELAEGKERLEEITKEIGSLKDKETALTKKNTELMGRLESAKAAHSAPSSSRTTTALLTAARNKNSPLSSAGILGRLGDLATISPKYDIAVSTACGGQLDSIVCRTTSGAKKSINFLREHNLGRARFIPLDNTKKGAHDRRVETPENAPRLFDLIQPRSVEIVPALYMAVKDTLVAKDMDTAMRLAFDYGKRWRVVTLDGKIVNPVGTLNGGGKPIKGKMRLASSRGGAVASQMSEEVMVTKEDVAKLQKEAEEVTRELGDVRTSIRNLTEERRSLEKKIHTLTKTLPKLTMEISGYDTTREELTRSLPALRSRSTLSPEDAAKLKTLTKKVEKVKTDMAACVMLCSKLESEKAKLQRAIVDAGGAPLKKQQKCCDVAKQKLDDAMNELNAAKVTISSSETAVKKAIKARETAEKELISCRETLDKNKETFERNKSDAKGVKEEYEKAKEREEEKRKVIESMEKEVEGLKKEGNKWKCKEIDLVAQLDNFKKQLKECERKIDKWDDEIERLVKAEENDEEYDVSDDEGDDDEDNKDDEDNEDKESTSDEKEGNSSENADVEMKDSTSKSSKKRKHESSSALQRYPPNKLSQYCPSDIKHSIQTLTSERDSLAKNANMAAIAEYRKKEADYLARVAEFDTITSERNDARKHHEELRRARLDMFMSGFGVITLKLKEMYQMITLGGDAELELVDSLDPFSEGIVFSVRPPKKSWKNIANLSGGEKTLSSLALVFALHHYKPTPLYVMDEIDAALDFKNVSIVANYIKDRTKDAQFVIISLRNNMFELADRLVGIYKTNNCTKSVTINPKAFVKRIGGVGNKMEDSSGAGERVVLEEKTNVMA